MTFLVILFQDIANRHCATGCTDW